MVKKNKKISGKTKSRTITTKNGEPSIHLSQKALFTGSIIAIVIIIIIIGIVVSKNCVCDKDEDKDQESKGNSESPTKKAKIIDNIYKKFSIGKEYATAKKIGILSQNEIEDRLKNTKERSQATIQKIFRNDIASKLQMKEYQEGDGNKIPWKAPPGVQPGTLVTPPIGYTKTKYANYDRGYGANKGRAAKYTYVPGQSFTTTFVKDSPIGQAHWGVNYSWDDNAPNGLMPPYVAGKEKAIGMGNSGVLIKQNDFIKTQNLIDNIKKSTWQTDRSDWKKIKEDAKKGIMKISNMFDDYLTNTVFPNMRKIDIGDGGFRVSDGDSEECISLERYYEFVANTISVQLGLEPTYSMQWAKGSNIKYGFENIDSSVNDLRKGLKWNCAEATTYSIKYGDVIYSEYDMEEVAYTIIWPKDYSVLYVHRMQIKK